VKALKIGGYEIKRVMAWEGGVPSRRPQCSLENTVSHDGSRTVICDEGLSDDCCASMLSPRKSEIGDRGLDLDFRSRHRHAAARLQPD
jgi:hypothetical protein